MNKNYTIEDIKRTSRCIFGMIYLLLFFLFVGSAGMVLYVEAEADRIATASRNNPITGNASESYAGVKLVGQAALINSGSGASGANDREGSHSQSYAGEVHQSELKYKQLSRIFTGVCLVLGGAGLASIPLTNYLVHTRPLQRYAASLLNQQGGKDTIVSPCSYGIIHLLGGILQLNAERQQESRALIHKISSGNFEENIEDADDPFLKELKYMQNKLRELSSEDRNSAWTNEHLTKLESFLKNTGENEKWSQDVVALLTKSISAGVGIMYFVERTQDDESVFRPVASYGCSFDRQGGRTISFGQGQLGQLAFDRKVLVIRKIPSTYMSIQSGLGESLPACIVMVPLIFQDEVYGALEFGCFIDVPQWQMHWLEKASESLAAHFFNQRVDAEAKRKLQDLANKQAQELVEIHRLQEHTFSKLEMKLKEVEEEKWKNQAILEGCVDGVLSFDEHGRIHFCNKAAAELFNAAAEVIISKKVFDLLNIRLDLEGASVKPYFLTANGEKEIAIRTEATIKSLRGEDVDVLLTSTQVELQHTIYFTFFIQKISVDLF
jgi:PAS domain-containing protein